MFGKLREKKGLVSQSLFGPHPLMFQSPLVWVWLKIPIVDDLDGSLLSCQEAQSLDFGRQERVNDEHYGLRATVKVQLLKKKREGERNKLQNEVMKSCDKKLNIVTQHSKIIKSYMVSFITVQRMQGYKTQYDCLSCRAKNPTHKHSYIYTKKSKFWWDISKYSLAVKLSLNLDLKNHSNQ